MTTIYSFQYTNKVHSIEVHEKMCGNKKLGSFFNPFPRADA